MNGLSGATNGNGKLHTTTKNTTNGLNNGINNHCLANNNKLGNGNVSVSNLNNNSHFINNNNNGASSLVQVGLQQIPLKAISWNYAIDVWWDKVMAEASSECEPVWVDAEDPLFILYTR